MKVHHIPLRDSDQSRLYGTKGPVESLIADELSRYLEKALARLEPNEIVAVSAKLKLPGAMLVKEVAILWKCKPQWVYQRANKALRRVCKDLSLSGFSPCL